MNNTTTENFQNNYDHAIYVSNIIWRSCGLLCTIFGIPGHIFHFLIMSNKTNRTEPTSLYFLSIAICEFIFSLGVLWLWCVGMSVTKIDPRQILSCGIVYSTLFGTTILSNLFLASMSIDRTYIILYPTRYRLLITRRHVLIRIFLILIIIIISLIPHHFYFYYDKNTTIFICDFYTPIVHWRNRIWPILHATLFVSLPLIITCASSVILLHNRCKYRRLQKNKLSENSRRIERNAAVLLFVSIVLSFSVLPAVILQIFIVNDRLSNHGTITPIRWKTYRILLNWFLAVGCINYSFKFYIRLSISKKFRRDFIQLISCILPRKENNNQQQLVPLNHQHRATSTEI